MPSRELSDSTVCVMLPRAANASLVSCGMPSISSSTTERRRKYADGTTYKGQPFRGSDGQMRYTAIYDLRDLMMEVPDFTDAPEMDLQVNLRNLGDRYWLQRRSQIYGGWADDVAAGVPLLRFFGGIDESGIPPSPNAAQQRYHEIMGILHEVLGSGSDAAAANN